LSAAIVGIRGCVVLTVARWARPHNPKIDNAKKVFFRDFMLGFAVRFERVVFRQLPLRSTVILTALPAMSLTPFAPLYFGNARGGQPALG